MSFFAILLALVFEQARPLGRENPAHASLRAWSGWARHALDAGQVPHGWLAWLLAVVLPALTAALVFWGLDRVHGLLGFVWVVVVLYLTLGFRQFSHHFTAIRVAMESGDDAGARQALARWKQVDVTESSRPVLLKQIIEHAVLLAHRHVFGVMVMFVVGALLGLGPAGAVLYRMAEHVARRWTAQTPVLAAMRLPKRRQRPGGMWTRCQCGSRLWRLPSSAISRKRSPIGVKTFATVPTITCCWPPQRVP